MTVHGQNRYGQPMKDKEPHPQQQPGKHAQAQAARRAAKSADALRANLMKRKQQTRARANPEDTSQEND